MSFFHKKSPREHDAVAPISLEQQESEPTQSISMENILDVAIAAEEAIGERYSKTSIAYKAAKKELASIVNRSLRLWESEYIRNYYNIQEIRVRFLLDFERCREYAEQGKAEAQYCLGLFYDLGINVRRNHNEAEKWLNKAASHNIPEIQFCVAYLNYNNFNNGLQYNYQDAIKWAKKANEKKIDGAKRLIDLFTEYMNQIKGDDIPF